MKKQYINPEILTTSMQATMMVCGSKKVTSVSGNGDLNYVGGGNGAARTKEYNDWDDDWE